MFKNLFTPMKIGAVEIPNRTVVTAAVALYCDDQGKATERYIAYHEAKAKGGWGLIITEDYAVDPAGKSFTCVAGLWDDSQIEGNIELTKRVHQYKSKIFAQIFHAGRQANPEVTGMEIVAPSPIPDPMVQVTPRELTADEIHKTVEQFGNSALRAKKAGFDGVEVHGGHGYLLCEFLSAYSNKRTDKYGGSIKNRARIVEEIIADIKAKAGKDFPVSVRISADEFVPGGLTIEDTKIIASFLEKAGADMINVSVGCNGSLERVAPPAAERHGVYVNLAAEIKKVIGIPVGTAGRINSPYLAESIIASGKADFVGMLRASMADPELPRKAAEGRVDEIRQCIGCLLGCVGEIFVNRPARCVINPTLGREKEFAIKPARVKKKVLVVGGGIAGMEAAITAAQAGHEVQVTEKSGRLGGQFYYASIPPHKGELSPFINWQINQLERLKVKVLLNTETTPEFIDSQKPDSVIIATGAVPAKPPITGINKANVIPAIDILDGKNMDGSKAVVIGGGMVGAETAEHLAVHGKSVTIVELLSDIAIDVPFSPRVYLLRELEELSIEVFVDSQVNEILDDGVKIVKDGKEKIIKSDFVVLAAGATSENKLAAELEGKPYEVSTIGDAVKARRALEAIEEGYIAGMQI